MATMQSKNNHHHLRIATRETLPPPVVVGVGHCATKIIIDNVVDLVFVHINHILHIFHVQQYILILFSLCMLLSLNHCLLLFLVPYLLHQSKFLVYEK